jgi:hypothetical protein
MAIKAKKKKRWGQLIATPNSPAVDLNRMTGVVKNQKIHFIRKSKNGK